MYGFMLFLHLAGLIAWVGSLLAIVVMLVLLKSQLGSSEANTLAKRIIRAFSMFAHPGALLVLISGVFLLIDSRWEGVKPLWLDIMVMGGGMIVILGLVLTGIMGSKAKKRMDSEQGQRVNISGYLITNAVFIALIVAIVLIVSLEIG